jgi:hypothetical protein
MPFNINAVNHGVISAARAERACPKKIRLIVLKRNREERSLASDSPLCGFQMADSQVGRVIEAVTSRSIEGDSPVSKSGLPVRGVMR